jgi:anti-sigma-K factor RskA
MPAKSIIKSNKLVYLQNNVVVFDVICNARFAGMMTETPPPTVIDITNNTQGIKLNWLYDATTGTFSAPVPVPPPTAQGE